MVWVKMITLLRLDKHVVSVKITISLKLGDLSRHGYNNNHEVKFRGQS